MRKIDMIPVSPNSSSPSLSLTTFLFQEIMKQFLQIIVMRRWKIKKVLSSNEKIKELSNIFTYAQNFIYLGRGYNYPIALEEPSN